MLLEIVLIVIGSVAVLAVVLGIAVWLVGSDRLFRIPSWRISSRRFPELAGAPDKSIPPLPDLAGKPDEFDGAILWNPPDRMKVGRRETIEVRLGDATVTEAALREGLRGRGTPNVDRLEIAPLMRVSLVGDTGDFSIQAINSKDQYVRPGKIARWDFGVTSLRSGIRRLRLLAAMRVRVEGKDEVVAGATHEIAAEAQLASGSVFSSKKG
jgi:hypothetical protein